VRDNCLLKLQRPVWYPLYFAFLNLNQIDRVFALDQGRCLAFSFSMKSKETREKLRKLEKYIRARAWIPQHLNRGHPRESRGIRLRPKLAKRNNQLGLQNQTEEEFCCDWSFAKPYSSYSKEPATDVFRLGFTNLDSEIRTFLTFETTIIVGFIDWGLSGRGNAIENFIR